MLIISETPPEDFGVYLIFDPWVNASRFLSLNLDRYGFLNLELEVKDLLIDNQNVKLSDYNLPFAVAGNRTNNLEFHLKKVKNRLYSNDKKVWLESSLLEDFLLHAKDLGEIEVEIIGKHSSVVASSTGNDLSMLLGLFGKFYSRNISKSESTLIGTIQESLKDCPTLKPLSYSDSLLILDVIQKSHDPKSPPINLIDKIKELILFTI